ncbi:isochorismatase family cysteine hydrolase [Shewanella psychrotolerans]|uniref:isochorismatase family cysteine hydrolase n=1 Tax=Shewanella psychrotolerans TaxID=2864206 RepID=UPI001C6589B7|nr:isochorismatase family cysteine hydrolase [Shewanella psychrotolerans]QYK01398.1 cysteine hydrolase [Shewanella psychrotolerans]
MAISTLDRGCALIIVDLQQGIVCMPTVHPISQVVDNSIKLKTAFKQKQLPVFLINVNGKAPGRNQLSPTTQKPAANWAELIPELDVSSDDKCISKQTWGAFHNTDLHQQLQNADVTQVVITGLMTSMGVESTARQAHEHGYNVTLVTDAITDTNLDAHNNSCTHIFPKLAECGTTEALLKLLQLDQHNNSAK